MFDPAQAIANMLGIVKGGLLLSGCACTVILFFKARPGGALMAGLAGCILYYVLEKGLYCSMGEAITRILTTCIIK